MTYRQNQNSIKRKNGGGCLVIFGLPFFLAGMFVLLGALDLIPVKIEEGQPRMLLAGFGFIFASIGAILIFGRTGMTIDPQTMNLVRWWGLVVPMKKTEYNLGLFQRVTIGRERRGSGKSSRTVYPVRLDGYEGTASFEYDAPGAYQEARRIGEELAEFLNFSLEDSTSGETIIRESSRLDESLQDRLKRTGESREPVTQPPEMKSTICEVDGELTVEIPPRGLKPLHLLPVVPGVIFAVCVYLFFFREFMELPAPGIIRLLFGGAIVIFFILAPLCVSLGHVLGRAARGYEISVDADVFRLLEKKVLRSRTVEIPLNELEELHLIQPELKIGPSLIREHRDRMMTDGEKQKVQRMLDSDSFLYKLLTSLVRSGIVARSDRQTIEFGKGLAGEELKYLHSRILGAIRNR